jgi:hypothetical protein
MYLMQMTYFLGIYEKNWFHTLKFPYIMIVKIEVQKQNNYTYQSYNFTLTVLEIWPKQITF